MKKFKKFVTYIPFLFAVYSGFSQPITHNAEVSLLTCSSGKELYATFGHSAIRVYDSITQTDIVFNYGVFDFNTPNFYWKFVNGKLKYQLAIQSSRRFIRMYEREGRSVIEEKIILKKDEKRDLLAFLKKNYLPENRYYLYDFFYNNCSSKIWDVTVKQINQPLYYDSDNRGAITFRQMLYPYLKDLPWAKLGINILLGMPADKTANFEDQVFLPDYLSYNMSHTLREKDKNNAQSLLGPRKVLVEKKTLENNDKLEPIRVFWILFALIFLLTILGVSKKILSIIDYIIYSSAGLLGLLLIFLWFISDHQAMNANLDLLWASPLALLMVICKIFGKDKFNKYLTGLYIFSILTLLAGWSFVSQQFSHSVIPISLLILTRLIFNGYLIKPPFIKRKFFTL